MKAACCRQEIVIHTDPKNCEYVIISGAERKNEEFDAEDAETLALPAEEERGKLVDPFYRLEHEGEDRQKGKEAEPFLVRLQRSSDLKHADDYARNRAMRSEIRSQKKRVAEETDHARKRGLGIRLLPASKEDTEMAANVKFSSRFEMNRRDKRAAINASSIFSDSTCSKSTDKRLELLAKRRKINATAAHSSLCGKFKPSSISQKISRSNIGARASLVVVKRG